jgi:ribosome-binding factor A
MTIRQQSSVKRAQKESLLQQVFGTFLLQLVLDDKRLQGLYLRRVKLSADKSVCTLFFYAQDGLEGFNERLRTLLLYKASLRKALADTVPSRYVPQLIFKFDNLYEKQQRIDQLLQKIKDEEVSE